MTITPDMFLEDFRGIFDETNSASVELLTNFREIEEWDSFSALSLIALMDEKYALKSTGEEIRNSKTVFDLFEKINK